MNLGVKDIAYVGIQFVLFLVYLYDVPFINFSLPSIVSAVFLGASFVGIGIVLISMMQQNIHITAKRPLYIC
jgi:hypothetical protein